MPKSKHLIISEIINCLLCLKYRTSKIRNKEAFSVIYISLPIWAWEYIWAGIFALHFSAKSLYIHIKTTTPLRWCQQYKH